MSDGLKKAHERVERIRKEGSEGLARFTAIRFMLWFHGEVQAKDKELLELRQKVRAEVFDKAIAEAGKERIVFIAKKDILFMDNDMKVRKHMRNEIVKALEKLKAEAMK